MGSRDDWFRSAAWAATDQEEFFARLARSRKSAAQYLRIKALSLQQAALFVDALELLSRFLQEYPGHFDTAQALLQQAQCFSALGRLEEAEAGFRHALRHEQSHGSVQTLAWIDFPWFIPGFTSESARWPADHRQDRRLVIGSRGSQIVADRVINRSILSG